MVIDFNDEVWAFGNNEFGQLGLGKKPQQILTPEKIHNFKAKDIALGYSHTVAISDYDF
jgi:alpha-tubulin suppressor-like RCC1 family protein